MLCVIYILYYTKVVKGRTRTWIILSVVRGKAIEFQVTGTHVWYYYICKREVWLMIPSAREANRTMKICRWGKAIGEHSYKRAKKEIDLGNAKLDLIRTENGQVVVGEVKKSSRFVESASKQLLFYLLQLKEMGIEARGELLIPEEKKRIDILLDEASEKEIIATIAKIEQIATAAKPPEPVKNKYCVNVLTVVLLDLNIIIKQSTIGLKYTK